MRDENLIICYKNHKNISSGCQNTKMQHKKCIKHTINTKLINIQKRQTFPNSFLTKCHIYVNVQNAAFFWAITVSFYIPKPLIEYTAISST